MKKITQDLKNGKTNILVSPMPSLKSGHLLIKSEYSVISLGTEKMLIDFGKANFLKKARLQPEKMKKIIAKMQTDGLVPTLKSVMNKLNEPISLGYSNAGTVCGIGTNVEGYRIGDRVISNGPHSDYFNAPVNLCAKIPGKVSNKEASLTVLGSISLQSIRLLQPSIGETVYVFGMGLIGLIAVQILINNGCNAVAIDYNSDRLDKAKSFGAKILKLIPNKNINSQIKQFDNFEKADGVIIATNTKSNEPIDIASAISRKRGKIILVGDSGLNINRTEFYNKELSFQVSRSYGPGRYDRLYEEEGIDYPIEYVRWTEKRNFEAILWLLNEGKLNFISLISHQFTLEESVNFYENINKPKYLGVVIKYNKDVSKETTIYNKDSKVILNDDIYLNTGFIGSGNYCSSILLPAFKKTKAKLVGIASLNGANAAIASKKFKINYCTSNSKQIIEDKNINNVVITTQHNSHFEFAEQSFLNNKNVFVEKPLCLTMEELNKLNANIFENKEKINFLTVGFNRRFSPLIATLKEKMILEKKPKMILINVNAGHIDENHWTQQKSKGGGRIIGEAIHFIDLATFLCGCDILNWKCSNVIGKSRDTCSLIIDFTDGSIANINYMSNGSSLYPKEKISVFCDNKVADIDNFKSIKFFNWPNSKNKKLFIQNKGQEECVLSFIRSCENKSEPPIPYKELYQAHKTAIEITDFIG